ncbi:autotransporter domain-containing protein [uncultured Algimonas sp.]|uniref:beta strand repeat-containing protein n=1 Tax=uncultured Algimonas sp. TaxID=1547920 RepID=UPI002618F64F|nr:autotransporter domain-containing protein [uncultured Algimonas sp.]
MKNLSFASVLLTGTSLVVLLSAQSAHAACTVDGDPQADASNPETGQTITCADNLDNDGVVNRQADNVTVNIEAPSGGISVTGQAGVALGDGATVTVAGNSNRPINTSGDSAPGIDVANGATITIDGQVATSGETSGAVRTGDDATVNVSGTVRTGGGDSGAVSVGSNSTIELTDKALVTTGNSNSPAVLIRGDMSTLNVGSDARVTTSSGMSNPVKVDGNSGTVNVSGDVRSSSGNATAILLTGNDAKVTVRGGGFVTAQSSGSNGIESQGTGATIRVERGGEVRISSGNSTAIVSGDEGTVEIAGEVSASSSQSQGVELGDKATLTMLEMGTISTSSSESQAVLINESATSATINVNEGGEIDAVGAQAIVSRGSADVTINADGMIFGGSSDPTIDLGGGDDMINIAGTVRGSTSDPVIKMAGGSDTLTIESNGTLDGSGKLLADLGEGSDTLNLRGGSYESSQFSGAETVNVGEAGSGGSGSGGSGTTAATAATAKFAAQGFVFQAPTGSGATYTVNDSQPNQSVNVQGSGSSVDIVDGGTVASSSASNGGSLTIRDGGNGGDVSSSSGGSVTVQSGGQANVSSESGNGGTTTFESGSNANVEGQGSSRRQDMRVSGADFQSGSSVNVNNSVFLSGAAQGDTISVALAENAFVDGVRGQGVSNANSLRAAAGLDRIAQAGTDDAALDQLDKIVLASAQSVDPIFQRISRQGEVQGAVGGLAAAQQFGDSLRAGASPLVSAAGFARNDRTLLAGPIMLSSDDGDSGIWASVNYGNIDVEAGDTTGIQSESVGYAAGFERRIELGLFDEAAVGIGVGYTYTDTNGPTTDGDAKSYSVGVYGGGTRGGFRSDLALSYTNSDIETLGADTGADVFTGRLEVGYDLTGDANSGLQITPFGRLSGTLASFDDIAAAGPTETQLRDGDLDQGVAGLGARLGLIDSGDTGAVKVSIEGAYEHVFGDRELAYEAQIGATQNAFSVLQTVADENRFHAAANVGLSISNTIDVALRWDGRFGSEVEDHRASLRGTIRF